MLPLQVELEALGYATMIEPLLTIEQVGLKTLPVLDGVQALVLTSAHAIPALSVHAKTLPIYAVGAATAEAARSAGCQDVMTSDGNALDLSRLIIEECRPEHGTILHLTGDVVREGLKEALNQRGFHYLRQATYRAIPRTRFSDDLIAAWRRRAISAVLLFSPRTAEILVRLLIHHGLERHVDRAAAICLSDQTATPCKALAWRTICPAARPNRQALLKALEGSTAIC